MDYTEEYYPDEDMDIPLENKHASVGSLPPPPTTQPQAKGEFREPWGHALWKHLREEHGLTLVESELQQIIQRAAPLAYDLTKVAVVDKSVIDQVKTALEVSLSNINSLGPAGALGPIYESYKVWQGVVENAILLLNEFMPLATGKTDLGSTRSESGTLSVRGGYVEGSFSPTAKLNAGGEG